MHQLRLTVLYGSQTGTAQDVAEEIWRQSKYYKFTGPILAMNDYDIHNLINERLVIFVCSTTGQGDEPDNMKSFWKFLLRKTLPKDSLKEMHFGVLGLGDSSYPKFNYAAKRLYKRLMQLSAKPIISVGLCDDQHDMGPSFVYLKWIDELWTSLKQEYMIQKSDINTNFIYKWNIKVVEEKPKIDIQALKQPLELGKVQEIQLVSNVRVTDKDHFQDVRLLTFSSGDLKWDPGDVLVIKPWNSDEAITKFFNILAEKKLNFNRNTVIKFYESDKEMPLPSYFKNPLTLEVIVKYLWDLNSIPRQSFFKLFAINCQNELEKEKLEEFGTPEGLEDMLNYAFRPKRTILEVFEDFPYATSALTLEILFELMPIIKSRSFSIASVPENNGSIKISDGSCKFLQLLVAVVEYKTRLKQLRKGLCSNWLKNLNINEKVQVIIRRGTMTIPQDLEIPIVMVGPGTGVAPFRSLLLQRELLQANKNNLLLFFGCRSQYKDFYCKEDWTRLMEKNIAKCFFAFSRDQENKRYVQHVIEEQSDLIKDLILNKSGMIFVAGNSKNMPTCVREAFEKVLGSKEIVENLIKQFRYQEETW